MIETISPFRPHRAKNQSPVDRRATLLDARVSSVEAEQEKPAQAFGMAATAGQATMTVVICEPRSGVLLGNCPVTEQVPGPDGRQDWIQKMPGSRNLTELHQVVHSQVYVVTADSSSHLALPMKSRSLVLLGPMARPICRETPRAFVGEAGQDEMLIGANALVGLPKFQQLALGFAAIPESRTWSVVDAWWGILSDILHDLHPGGVISAPGESGVPGPDLSKARRHIHRSHGFGWGAWQQTTGRRRRPDNLGKTPDGKLGTGCCSPGDEPILTTTGWVAIKDLDPARDKLAGHHRPINRMTWGGTSNPATDGFMFERSASPYRGNLIVLETEQGRTRVTPNHRVPVRLNDAFPEKWCVYLMRNGNWWRIGACATAHRPYRSGGVSGRLGTEQGAAAWILSVHDTRVRALIAEARWQGRYGVPGFTFRSAEARSLSNRQLANIHEEISADVQERVGELFTDTGLQPDTPLYVRGVLGTHGLKKKILGTTFTTAAGNLPPLSRYLDITVPQRSFIERNHKNRSMQPALLQATITTEPFEGDVYGLYVPPYHHYVSGGAVVHDSSQGYPGPGRVVALSLT